MLSLKSNYFLRCNELINKKNLQSKKTTTLPITSELRINTHIYQISINTHTIYTSSILNYYSLRERQIFPNFQNCSKSSKTLLHITLISQSIPSSSSPSATNETSRRFTFSAFFYVLRERHSNRQYLHIEHI